jgi:hypothetical protein
MVRLPIRSLKLSNKISNKGHPKLALALALETERLTAGGASLGAKNDIGVK